MPRPVRIIISVMFIALSLVFFASCSDSNTLPFEWTTDCTHCSPTLTKNVAVMIEPRKTEPVVEIIHNVADNLHPFDDWTLQVFHSADNEAQIKNDARLAQYISQGKLVLTKLSINNLTVPLYDRIIYSTKFWNDLRGDDKVLIFQTDAGLCANPTKALTSFFEYDYVGAPWKDYGPVCGLHTKGNKTYVDVLDFGSFTKAQIADKSSSFADTMSKDTTAKDVRSFYQQVGNGGLSLYSKKKWLDALVNYVPVAKDGALPGSDQFFSCVAADNKNMKVPDVSLASDFSVEALANKHPVGFHKPWLYLSVAELDALGKVCPVLNDVSKKFYTKIWGR